MGHAIIFELKQPLSNQQVEATRYYNKWKSVTLPMAVIICIIGFICFIMSQHSFNRVIGTLCSIKYR